ncbi:Hypothetical protein NTJ_13975 [Nesidiocoris tenuis]|uniref:Uncharacterized protein n=1 Tax=Nesidiocoris tenuis TaxID=355587 RepID=A0ABN7B9V1_9HEMI|nr:Hypothetical protein NTJ_13975 [Nesidiocoris tenuis]
MAAVRGRRSRAAKANAPVAGGPPSLNYIIVRPGPENDRQGDSLPRLITGRRANRLRSHGRAAGGSERGTAGVARWLATRV